MPPRPSSHGSTIRHTALITVAGMLIGCGGDSVAPTESGSIGNRGGPPGSPGEPLAPPASAPAADPVLLEGRIAFVSAQGGTAHVFTLNGDGSGATAVTSGPATGHESRSCALLASAGRTST